MNPEKQIFVNNQPCIIASSELSHGIFDDELEVDSSLLRGPLPPGFEEYETHNDEPWGSEFYPGRCSLEAPATQNLNDASVASNENNERFSSAIEPTPVSSVQNDVSFRLPTSSSENSTSEDEENMATDFGSDPDIDCDSDLDAIESLGRPEGYESAQSFENEEVYTSDEDSNPTIAIEPLNQISIDTISSGDENENELEQTNNRKRKCQVNEKLTRKRLKNPEKWKKNLNKIAANRGLEYKSLSTEKTIPARMMRRGCGPGCKFKCEGKISEERRGSIFKVYYSIPNQSAKYDYIARHVKRMKKQTNQGKVTRKSYTCIYSLTNEDNESIRVCQTMFLATLDISVSAVRTVLNKISNQDPILIDMRGKAPKIAQKTDEMKISSVRQHISLFPRVESHYTRENSKREYLEENLNITKMYRLYLEWAKEEGKAVASQQCYNKIFNEEFNISFFKRKKDSCDVCDGHKNASAQDKIKLEKNFQEHVQNENFARALKAADAEFAKKNKGGTTCVACFDFQKVLNTPQSTSSSLYYKRKLSVYNFTVYDIGNHQGWCYVWSEYDAKKGGNEVASCLFQFFGARRDKGVTKFLLYCDNCTGQNKNSIVFAMLVYVAIILGIEIVLTFLETGHTQMEADAMNWKRVVSKTSRPSSQPVGIASFKQLSVSEKLGHKIMYKKSFQKDFECLVTRKGPEDANMKKFQLRKAYFDVQGLPKDTRKDLVDLCEKNIIKYPYHEYYKSFKVREVDDAQLQSGSKPAQSQAEKNTSQPRSARIVARVHSAKKIPLPRPAQGTAQP
ncbi:hypothetical protein QAD02_012553 [Eretmocerus hayati]|uniref:Uncharacterized protein n=1 Tax=Eretmocerus hayati TaxID=131215 RepID=A0ACC2P1Q9_9HYME|nr:hypothetical protein QAD02_012553 [Eretmocerus hayati]